LFVYEPSRDIFKHMGSSENCKKIKGFKIYLSDKENLKNELYENKISEYYFTEEEKFGCFEKFEKLCLYPIFYSGSLLGVLGLSDIDFDRINLDEKLKSFAVLLNLVIEKLSIEELKDKINMIKEFTKIIESTLDEDTLIYKTMETFKNSFHSRSIIFWKLQSEKLIMSQSIGINEDEIICHFLHLDNSIEGNSLTIDDGILEIGSKNFENYAKAFNFKIKSAMFSRLQIDGVLLGVIAIYNRKEEFGYRPYKHFDKFDLNFLNDSVKRLGIALSRINLYTRLKNEISKLRNLKESHEELINFQKEHLEKMNALHKISQAIRSTYDKNNAVKIMLLGLTAGRGLKFNRALYLERDRVRGFLIPFLWLGPSEGEDVTESWREANRRAIKYGNIVQYLREEALQIPNHNKLTESIGNKVLAYKGHPILDRVVNKKQIVNVVPQTLKVKKEEFEDIIDIIKTDSFLIFPVTGKFETKGIVIVDNSITKTPISNVDIEIIRLFQDSVGLSLEMIENYEELRQKTKILEEQKNLMDYYRRFKENILHNLAVAIIVVDRKGKIIEWNQKAEVLFSRPRENMMGSKINFFSEIVGEDIINTIEEIYVSKTDLKYPDYKVNISGEKKIFDIQFSPLWNRELGVIEGVIIVFDDVTELYSLQREMERRERLAAIGEMTARIAHEIRNPLTVIGGFLKRMTKKLDEPDSIKKYSKIIDDELNRLEVIVSEILEYSRGNKITQLEESNLVELVRDVIIMYEDFISQKNIFLNTDWVDSGEITVDIDRSKIKQVLINLIKNSIEIVENGGKIDIKIGKNEKFAFFEIENNGPVIEEEYQNKLFMPFFTTKTYGTGLGLPICKKIIEDEHKGRLFLLKSDDISTIFRFEIPFEKQN